jgi:hypothetical protein
VSALPCFSVLFELEPSGSVGTERLMRRGSWRGQTGMAAAEKENAMLKEQLSTAQKVIGRH